MRIDPNIQIVARKVILVAALYKRLPRIRTVRLFVQIKRVVLFVIQHIRGVVFLRIRRGRKAQFQMRNQTAYYIVGHGKTAEENGLVGKVELYVVWHGNVRFIKRMFAVIHLSFAYVFGRRIAEICAQRVGLAVYRLGKPYGERQFEMRHCAVLAAVFEIVARPLFHQRVIVVRLVGKGHVFGEYHRAVGVIVEHVYANLEIVARVIRRYRNAVYNIVELRHVSLHLVLHNEREVARARPNAQIEHAVGKRHFGVFGREVERVNVVPHQRVFYIAHGDSARFVHRFGVHHKLHLEHFVYQYVCIRTRQHAAEFVYGHAVFHRNARQQRPRRDLRQYAAVRNGARLVHIEKRFVAGRARILDLTVGNGMERVGHKIDVVQKFFVGDRFFVALADRIFHLQLIVGVRLFAERRGVYIRAVFIGERSRGVLLQRGAVHRYAERGRAVKHNPFAQNI